MSTKQRRGRDGDSPLDVLARSFALLAEGPGQPAVNGRMLGHGLPSRLIRVGELAQVLPALPEAGQDAVWAELVRRARTRGPVWVVVAAGLALPRLRLAAARLTRGLRDDAIDVDAELLAGFLAALGQIDLDGSGIAVRLCRLASAAGARARYAHDAYAVRHVSLGVAARRAALPPRPYGHPDLVLADAVAKGVINAREAELIGGTRIDRQSLKQVAAQLDIPYETAKSQRRHAEPRLVDAILAEEVQTIITPIRSVIPYPEVEEDSRRGRRASGCSPVAHPTRKEAGQPAPASPQLPTGDQPPENDDQPPVEKHEPTARRGRLRRLAAVTAVLIGLAVAVVLGVADVVSAAPCPDTHQLTNVIDNLRNWLIGIIVTLATLFLTIGGIRYLLAGGDPSEIHKAKDTLKYGAVGFGVAALAPVLVSILKQIVGGTPCQ